MLGASKFEFEKRFWVIGAIFAVGFGLYAVDQMGLLPYILHLIAPAIDPGSARGVQAQQVLLVVSALLIFYASLFRTWATAYLGADVMADRKQHSDALTVDGPYRYVRNPLYFANLPLAAGVGFFASRLGFVFMVLGMLVFVYRLILREEPALRAQLGQSYADYTKRVPRLWPSWSPRYPASGRKPRWFQAIAGELLFWLMGVTVLVFAATLDQKLLAIGFAASFAIGIAVHSLIGKRDAPKT